MTGNERVERGWPGAAGLRRAYRLMRRRFGPQGWWPGETPFEVCVGAILTQNTTWSNVERAIAQLRRAGVLEPRALAALSESELALLIRPAGCFRVKARRLRAFLKALVNECEGAVERLLAGPTEDVRRRLLAIPGIGPETADCMLLYAGAHLRFVVDAYTRRVFSRHGWLRGDEDYETIQARCEEALARGKSEEVLDLWRDYHAQLVQVGKTYCRAREPRCAECPLRELLPRGSPVIDGWPQIPVGRH